MLISISNRKKENKNLILNKLPSKKQIVFIDDTIKTMKSYTNKIDLKWKHLTDKSSNPFMKCLQENLTILMEYYTNLCSKIADLYNYLNDGGIITEKEIVI